ncbi:hypothetical protein WM25_16115 [Burkholderia ubonensis]|nr:hypothetical protein WM25_16115 [Burkholderia ubonensis]
MYRTATAILPFERIQQVVGKRRIKVVGDPYLPLEEAILVDGLERHEPDPGLAVLRDHDVLAGDRGIDEPLQIERGVVEVCVPHAGLH